MARTPTLLSIQYLRGAAALAVVAMHTGWTYSGIGAAGVDVFFVISGFIMVHVSQRETTPRLFLLARARRVVPLYWLASLATIAVTGLSDLPRILTSFVFWPHAGFDGRDYPVVIQGWTLNYEVFFYAVFALSLASPRRRLEAVSVGFILLVAAGRWLQPQSVAAAVYTGPLLLEFLGGAWLCRAWQHGKLPGRLGSASLVAVGLIAFAVQARIGPSGDWRCLTWGLPALLLVAGALGLEASGSLMRLPGFRMLGDASYALYLTHLLVQHPLIPVLRPLPLPIALPLMLSACIAVAVAVHRGIERPLARLFQPLPRLAAAG